MSLHYVWLYSSKELEPYLKISALWAGSEGSLLLWCWLILLFIIVEKKCYGKTKLISLSVFIALLSILIATNPFSQTHAIEVNNIKFSIDNYPNGLGLNPLLRNVFTLIHPPIIFIGYASSLLLFSSSIAFIFTKEEKLLEVSIKWGRITWLFLLLGIFIGGVWAYLTLGWGGYWAWDPVEIASLLPFLALTAFLHSAKNKYGIIFSFASFILVLFAAFVTRSGYWFSVHAFGFEKISYVFGALILSLFIFGLFVISRAYHKINLPVSKERIFLGMLFLLSLITLVLLIGMFVSMKKYSPVYFEERIGPLFGILIALIGICMKRKHSPLFYIPILIISILSGVLFSIFFPKDDFLFIGRSFAVGFLIPIIFFSVFSVLYKLYRNKARGVFSQLIHLGIAFLVFGHAISTTFSEEKKIIVKENEASSFDAYIFEFKNKKEWKEYGKDIIEYEILVKKNGIKQGELKIQKIYYTDIHERINNVALLSTLKEDIYATFIAEYEIENLTNLEISVKIIPLINFVWAGSILMVIGMFCRIIEASFCRR